MESVSIQVQVVACAPPPPPAKNISSDLRLLPPSEDHKALMRICVWRIVLSVFLVCEFSLLLYSRHFVHVFLTHLLCVSSSCSESLCFLPLPPFFSLSLCQITQVNSVYLGQVWECRFAAFIGLKESRAAHVVITSGRVCACVELNQSCHSDYAMSPVIHPQYICSSHQLSLCDCFTGETP